VTFLYTVSAFRPRPRHRWIPRDLSHSTTWQQEALVIPSRLQEFTPMS